jgi:hypothetical protein
LALRADSVELEHVAQVSVVESLADFVRPRFEFGRIDLHRRAAASTREVVMMNVNDAATIETLTPIRHDHVDFATLDQPFQLGVDGGEGNLATVLHDQTM